ncbi:MAG: hypothetical protein IPH33_11750 [Bacteroidetes bacterium]|nr:hypothetical protein [Bacteroidota bacterium]
MKSLITFLFSLIVACNAFSQDTEYNAFVTTADSLYRIQNYRESAIEYSKAFKTFGWKGYLVDRYNAACSWALANEVDSALFQLNIIVKKMNYKDYNDIVTDPDLTSLHSDKRWNELLEQIKSNKEKAEANLDKTLVATLDSIFNDDQNGRQQLKEVEAIYGVDSKELKAHWKMISEKDSINLIKVKTILDTRGWLGEDVVGEQGNTTLFLVIQHSDIKTQERYLPMMRQAVKNGKAKGSSLALLEDRVALRQGRMQIYGSQINRDIKTQSYYVSPLEDPDNVDKRRAEVGLQPLAEYLLNWNLVWDVEQYKKDLPGIMEKWKNP